MLQVFQTVLAALIITFCAWLSKRNPQSAGLLTALPLTSMLVLPFSYWQHGEGETSVTLAQEILRAIPVSITFFLPFAFANKLGLSFGQAYAAGFALLVVSYFVMRGLSS